jgi:hypothetical protein
MIIVDSREPTIFLGIGDVIEKLEYGDFILADGEKKIILERKTISSFYTDLHSNRLNDQLTGCDGLIIHHNDSDSDYTDNVEDYFDKINGISTHHMVFHVANIKHLDRTLRRYEQYLIDGTFGQFRQYAKKAQLPTTIRILAQFEHIGVDRAWLLWKHFGTIENIFAALTSDFEDTAWPSGIGSALYHRMRDNMRAKC